MLASCSPWRIECVGDVVTEFEIGSPVSEGDRVVLNATAFLAAAFGCNCSARDLFG
jgi:hypothetical protein